MQIDKNAKLKADMDKTLATSNFNLKPDIWFWMMLEMVGNQMADQVSGSTLLNAQHARIDIPRDQINLLTRGGGVIFYDHGRVWKALPLAK